MAIQLLHDFAASFSEGLTKHTLTTCSRWASRVRMMGEPFPGPFTTKYHPWIKDLLDSEATFNWTCKAAQLGLTELGITRALYTICQLKRDVLYVLPSDLNAADFSRSRFATSLRLSPKLAAAFTETDTIGLKQAGNNTLYIRGARSEAGLKSVPVSLLVMDELDVFPEKSVNLALERLSGQLVKQVWGVSTPTIPSWGAHKYFLTSTQEHFRFICPSCSRWIELVWPDSVEIVGEHVADPRCHKSYLKCTKCGARLEHKEKPVWLATGKWRPTVENPNMDIRGFHISQLYSFTITPGEVVQAYFRGFGDESAQQEFYNSKLGLPFVGEGAQLTDADLQACIGSHSMEDERPRDGRGLRTLGVDVGKFSFWTVVEWYFDDYGPDLNVLAFGKVLAAGKFLEDQFDCALDDLMRTWQVKCACIDADPWTNEARRFARRFPGFVYLVRYRKGVTGKELSISDTEDYAPIVTADRSSWLSATLGRFRAKRISLPRNIPSEYLAHLPNLVRCYEKDDTGNLRTVYKEIGADHFCHATNYAEIALPLGAAITTGKDIQRFL
jgi:hypothetical protein